MTRKIETNDKDVLASLNRLIDQKTTPTDYRKTMYKIGQMMARDFIKKRDDLVKPLLLVSTVEDADYLSKGILDALYPEDVHFACFWNERLTVGNYSVAPIIRQYQEPLEQGVDVTVIIVKSIISSGCVIKTNLKKLLKTVHAKSILIMAPVLLEGVEEALMQEFTEQSNKKFEFFAYAKDDKIIERNNERLVEPGIGGNVYKRLGLGSSSQKNTIVPEIVKQRRKKLMAAHHA